MRLCTVTSERDALWEVEGEVASRLEGFRCAAVAEAMDNLADRFRNLAGDCTLRLENVPRGSLAEAEHKAERSVYLEAQGMARAEAAFLWKEAKLREVRAEG